MTTPHELAEERVRLSGEYARDSEILTQILTQKAAIWMSYREGVKSDRAADKAWDATPLGVDEMRLRLKMKAVEKQLSALKSMLEVLEGEARNTY